MKAPTLLVALALPLATHGAVTSARTLPSDPVAGEAFIVVADGLVTARSARVDSASARVENGAVRIDTRVTLIERVNSVDTASYRAQAALAGAAAGSYPIVAFEGGSPEPVTVGSVTVRPAASPAAVPAFRGLSGNWFNDGESGWGVNVVQGDSGALFVAWLAYEPVPGAAVTRSQRALWLVMPAGTWISPTEFRGLLYRTTGSAVNFTFDPARTKAEPAGYATLRFTSPTEAQFYGTAGVGTLPIFEKLKPVRRMAF